MKRIFAILTLLFLISWTNVKAIGWTGSGTSGEPYQITTDVELALLATNVNGGNTYAGTYFKLMNDLSLSAYSNWDPIGNDYPIFFMGVFDGNNKKITGLSITNEWGVFLGLFGNIHSGCEIKDLTIEGCSVTGYDPVGALVGNVYLDERDKAIKITNCKSSGTVSAHYYVGGLIGLVQRSNGIGGDINTVLITNCSSSATVSCSEENAYAGGLIGSITADDITSTPIVRNSYATGSVTANRNSNNSGGLIGFIRGSKIENCYARGNISATGLGGFAGGFTGYVTGSSITNCYSTGAITGTDINVLGFIGFNDTAYGESLGMPWSITSCSWDKDTSGKPTSGGTEVGKTTLQMKTQGTFDGWDFTTPVWKIDGTNNNGYPYLAYQTFPAPEIDVKQSTTAIADGTGTFDFGSHATFTNTDIEFTIENTGAVASTLGNFTVTGDNANQFSVQGTAPTTVAASGTATFTVRFAPTSGGSKSATISFDNQDANENPYSFALTGSGIPTLTWDGSESSNWNTSGNWNGNAVPVQTDNAIIPGVGITNYPVVNELSASPAVCNNLTINSGGKLTIAAGKALTVNGNLTSSADSTGLVLKSDINGTGSLKILGSVSAPASVQRFASLNRWYLVSSPIGTQTLKDFIDKNTDIPVLSNDANTYGIRDYATGALSNWNDYFTNNYLTTNSAREMGVGKGYLVRTYTDGSPKTLNFQGNLNSQGNLDVTLIKSGTNGWNLIGNPYASAIKIHDGTSEIEATPDNFINANDAKFDDVAYGVYFWNDASSPKKFDVINNINKPITYAQVGQGFFVRAKAAGSSTMSFTTPMQFHKGDEALKSTTIANPKIELIASLSGQSASTDILFVEGATKGLDRGFDAGILKADPSFALYTKLVEPFDAEFQLQCLPINQYNNLVIPIGLDSKSAGEIVLSVQTVQLDPNCKVILEDKLTHTFTDLSKESYKAAIAANTTGAGRFFLHTGDIISGLEDQELAAGKLTAYANGNKEIRVLGEVGDGAVATLFNGLGQVVLTKKLGAGNLNIIGLPNLISGVYLLNINDNGAPQTIKVMVRK